MDYVNAFWVGGLICALAQILLDRTKLLPGRVMVLLVCLGAIISFFGWYEPFAEYAGAGANVPLLGYGNILMKGINPAGTEWRQCDLSALHRRGRYPALFLSYGRLDL